jgi:hypothetical protein
VNPESWLTLVNSGGVVAVLVIQVVMLVRGDLVSRSVLQEIIRSTVVLLLQEIRKDPERLHPPRE